MDRKCIIAGAGDFFEKEIIKNENDLLVASDGGLDYLNSLGLSPDLFIGDCDSLKGKKSDDTESIIFPSKKDDSDTLLAIKEGLKRGFKTFFIFGGTGGRVDHTMANIKALQFLSENGAQGFLFFQNQVMTVISKSISFPSSFKGYFSIFPTGGKACGIDIKNAAYELNSYDLESSSSLGLSNEFTGKSAEIEVKEGFLAVIFERQGIYKLGK